MQRFAVNLSYEIQYDADTALPGIEKFYSKDELRQPIYSVSFDEYWANSEEEALREAVRLLFNEVCENKLCAHGKVRILDTYVEEREVRK